MFLNSSNDVEPYRDDTVRDQQTKFYIRIELFLPHLLMLDKNIQ